MRSNRLDRLTIIQCTHATMKVIATKRVTQVQLKQARSLRQADIDERRVGIVLPKPIEFFV